jgi:outer membrane protein assembly factor BamD (BamD/ComL family)
LYFDSLKKYSLAKAYYDSAIADLPKDFDNYAIIKKRQEVLGDFVKYTETITLQDSLLRMASMDSLTLRRQLDSGFAIKRKVLEAALKKKKKRNDSGGGGGGGDINSSNPFFNQDKKDNSNSDDVGWYFANPSAISLGQTEFQRIWGTVTLEDNWRRSSRASTILNVNPDQAATAQNPDSPGKPKEEKPEKKVEKVDEAAKIFAQLPRTEQQKKAALAKIEEAYFKLGDLYYFQLGEKKNAAVSYRHLLDRFPESEHEPEVLYKMYLIQKEIGSDYEQYADLLKKKHPNSTFTRILLNPDYLKESSVAAEKQKLIYKDAYVDYQNGNLRSAQEKINRARKEGDTGFSSQLELLQILILGKTEDITKYQFSLEEYMKKYPDAPLKPYAAKLLKSSQLLQEKIEKAKGIRFIASFKEPHYMVLVYKLSEKLTDPVSQALEAFDKSEFKDLKLSTSSLTFNEDLALSMVTAFPDRESAMVYFDKFTSVSATLKPFALHNFNTFVITKDNFDTFYRTKALDEYLTFFDRNYQTKNP